MEGFGASGKAEDLFEHFGITAKNAAAKISEELIKRRNKKKSRIKEFKDEFGININKQVEI
jgi:pyruvate dehydrogenase complex dehydrogenase (E1) component